MIKVGIIGCGTIGKELALACQKRFAEEVTLTALADLDHARARKLQQQLRPKPVVISTDKLISLCDLVIEAASAETAYEVAKKALSQGKDIMVMSAGGILGKEKEIMRLSRTHR